MDEVPKIVSVKGALRWMQKPRENVLDVHVDVKGDEHISINGDYIRTEHIVNEYPVYVKINGQQWTVPAECPGPGFSESQRTALYCNNTTNRFCFMMNTLQTEWVLKVSADPDDFVGLTKINIHGDCTSKDLCDLVGTQTETKRLQLLAYEEATITLKTVAETMAGIAEAATTHAQRKTMLTENFECCLCQIDKPLREFVALQCGHAFCATCNGQNIAIGSGRKTCPLGCPAPVTRYNKVIEFSDFAKLKLSNDTKSLFTSGFVSTNSYIVRWSTQEKRRGV